MKAIYQVVTPKGQYVCEIFAHPSKGFVWNANGRHLNYAIPTNLPSSRECLLFQVQSSFGRRDLLIESLRGEAN